MKQIPLEVKVRIDLENSGNGVGHISSSLPKDDMHTKKAVLMFATGADRVVCDISFEARVFYKKTLDAAFPDDSGYAVRELTYVKE